MSVGKNIYVTLPYGEGALNENVYKCLGCAHNGIKVAT